MSLRVEARLRLGDFRLDVAFAEAGPVTALFGPSGSGKTTVASLVAGLLRPEEGRIEVDGETLTGTAPRVFVPPYRRRIGYVFQDARLFPHLSVRSNLLYGRWLAPRGVPRVALEPVVAMLGLGELLARRPGGLSGGERQRVAIGRALLCGPRLLVLDEPLASLDGARKAEILPYLDRLKASGVPMLYVSHAADEVRRLADGVVRLEAGRVAARGTPDEVLGAG